MLGGKLEMVMSLQNEIMVSIDWSPTRRENYVLGLKLHAKPFKYVWINVFWRPKQYLRLWRNFEKSSKIIIFGSTGPLEVPIRHVISDHFCASKKFSPPLSADIWGRYLKILYMRKGSPKHSSTYSKIILMISFPDFFINRLEVQKNVFFGHFCRFFTPPLLLKSSDFIAFGPKR